MNELRAKLVERLKREAGYVRGEHHDDRLQKLVLVHQAIQAIDAVIAEGSIEESPEEPGDPIIVKF